MRNKPGNIALAILATCMLADILIAKPGDQGDFLISIGIFGALLSRALLDDPQSFAICFLGLALTIEGVFRNHGIIDRDSDFWYVLGLVIVGLYAFWEKIRNWLSL
jgi:hypothetical protein